MRLAILGSLLLLPVPLHGQDRPPPEKIKVAEGIYLFRSSRYSDVGLDGNSIAILSPDGVLVFDANGTPAAARAVLAEIRKLTSAPVRYLVNSHWHWDHWYGTEVYRQEFPGIQIITHERTRRLESGPVIEWNQPFLETQLPAHLADLEKQVASLQTSKPGSPELEQARKHLAADRYFYEQKHNAKHPVADLTFVDSLTIYLGEREIKVLNYGRAVTSGDAFLYLPKEKVVVSGDLVLDPITWALGAYPSGWIHTLERLDSLDFAIMVPGHGTPMTDKTVLEAYIPLLKALYASGKASKANGLDVEQARAAALELPEVKDIRRRLTKDDSVLNQQFSGQVVDWFMHRVYDELDGKLTDGMPPAPKH